jgi:hypothetical protein
MEISRCYIGPLTWEHWIIYFDNSFTLNGAGGGIILISPKGDLLLYVIQLHFYPMNNVAECEALINSMHICDDSDLVVNQVMGESNCHAPTWRHTARR